MPTLKLVGNFNDSQVCLVPISLSWLAIGFCTLQPKGVSGAKLPYGWVGWFRISGVFFLAVKRCWLIFFRDPGIISLRLVVEIPLKLRVLAPSWGGLHPGVLNHQQVSKPVSEFHGETRCYLKFGLIFV